MYVCTLHTHIYIYNKIHTCIWDSAAPNSKLKKRKCKKVAQLGTMIPFIGGGHMLNPWWVGWVGLQGGFHRDNFLPRKTLEFKDQPQEQVESHEPIRIIGITIWLAQVSTSRRFKATTLHEEQPPYQEAPPFGSPSLPTYPLVHPDISRSIQ